MKKLILTALAFAGLASGPGFAADMPVKARAPVPAAVTWHGCYFGIQGGGVWGRSNIDIPLYPSNFDIDMRSLTLGGQVGCNYQFAPNIVIGIEGDWGWMDLKGDALSGGGGAERYSVQWDWQASVRGRLGFVAPADTLWYVTGGPAWAHLKSTNFIPGLAVTVAQSGTHSGWTFGGGVEKAFGGPNPTWIIGVEVLHATYQSRNYVFLGPVDVDLRTWTAVARLSAKFP